MSSLVCTIAYGNYHLGAAALANSLAANGFRGELWIRTSETTLPWVSDMDQNGYFKISDGFIGRLICKTPQGLVVLEKPEFLLQAIELGGQQFDDFFFIDADIVIAAPWAYYKDWVRNGLAICCDVNDPYMLPTHPLRRAWTHHIEQVGYNAREITGYFNSGFIGLRVDSVEVIRVWKAFCLWFAETFKNVDTISSHQHTKAWAVPDQDLFNAALMATNVPISVAGLSAMGFEYGRTVMLHAIGPRKPWQKFFLLEALNGLAPSRADKAFWQNTINPLKPFSNFKVRLKRIDLFIATIFSRFYRR